MSRINYDPPVPVGEKCHHCLKPLVARARIIDGLQLKGCNEYEYAHEDGTTECVLIYVAQPYDAWSATRRIEEALEERYAAEDVL